MAFYDSMKDRVRGEDEDEDDNKGAKGKKGGTMPFEELKKSAEEVEDEQDEEPDNTEIEDLSSASSNDYADPSSIELGEDDEPQAGRQTKEATSTGDMQERSKTVDKEVELHDDGSVEKPDVATEDSAQESGSGSELGVLREIREQNQTIIRLLRGIKKGLDRG